MATERRYGGFHVGERFKMIISYGIAYADMEYFISKTVYSITILILNDWRKAV